MLFQTCIKAEESLRFLINFLKEFKPKFLSPAQSSTSEPTCFVPGECQHSTFLDESITLGENSCLHFCQEIKGCQWFTYHPENSLCVATADCLKLNSTGDAISGMFNCSDLDNRCWVKGICQGTLLTEVRICFLILYRPQVI